MVATLDFTCENLRVERGTGKKKTPVLKNISFALSAGKITALVGPNGVGKSTLLKTLAGLLYPLEGRITWQGKLCYSLPKEEVGAVLENAGAYTWMNPQQYLLFFAELYQKSVEEVQEVRDLVGINLAEKPIHQLSRGDQTTLHIMRSLLHQPRLLLWDEVFNHLDPQRQLHIEKVLKKYCESRGASCILSTHHLHRLPSFADGYLFLNAGEKIWEGSGAQLSHDLKKTGYLFSVSVQLEDFEIDFIQRNLKGTLEKTNQHLTQLGEEEGQTYFFKTSSTLNLEDWQRELSAMGKKLLWVTPEYQSIEDWYQQRVCHE